MDHIRGDMAMDTGDNMITYEQAVIWARELGIHVRANDQAVECWIDRVYLAGLTGKLEDIAEANRYSGYRGR